MDFADALLGTSIDLNNLLLEKFQDLLSRYWIYARAAIITTRSYREGILFVDKLDKLNLDFWEHEQISIDEYESNDQKLILFRLQLLDKLDRWKEYAELFDFVRTEKTYTYDYHREYGRDPVFDLYIVSVVETKYRREFDNEIPILRVHFLYLQHHRYELIVRKYEKWKQGKKVGNLRHKPQTQLTEKQIQDKFDYIMDAARQGMQIFESW